MTAARNVAAIVQKEWRHYFGSPIAWVALFAWTLLFGGFFYLYFSVFVQRSAMSMQQMEMGGAPPMSLNDWVISPVLQTMAQVALFLAPLLTMRLFAEEKRQGTLELLATSPLTDLQIVMGKFLSALGLFAVMILAGLLNIALLWSYATAKPEWKPLAIGALGLLLLGGAVIALGLFISTLTRNQIVAGIGCLCLSLVLLMLGWADDPMAGNFAKVIAYLGIVKHLDDLMRGVVALKDVAYYLSVITFGVFLAHQSVQSQRWRA